jgi:hypothetical protein
MVLVVFICIFYSNGECFRDFGETIPEPQNSNGDDGFCDLDYSSRHYC